MIIAPAFRIQLKHLEELMMSPEGAEYWWCFSVFTYRKCNLTQFVCPVVQLLSVDSKHVELFCGLDEEWSRVSGTSVQHQLRHADAVGQTDHLECINLQVRSTHAGNS